MVGLLRCMVVWCTQNAPRWQKFRVTPARFLYNYIWLVLLETVAISATHTHTHTHQTTLQLHHLGGYSTGAVKSYSHSFRITRDKNAVSLLESGE